MLGPGFPGLQHSPGGGERNGAGTADLGTESAPPHFSDKACEDKHPQESEK